MFLENEDLNSHIYSEIVDAISQSDATILTTAIKAATGEAKGYLGRFNITELFSKTGDDRDPILLMYLKDIAVWHFIPLANANMDLDFREGRYNSAIAWLKNIQAGRVTPEGWPLAEAEEKANYFQYGSNPKRRNHY